MDKKEWDEVMKAIRNTNRYFAQIQEQGTDAISIEVKGQPHSYTRKHIVQNKLDVYVNGHAEREMTDEQRQALRGNY